LGALNPDAVAARTVIARYHHDEHLDDEYLRRLSADAVDEIDRLPEPARSCVLTSLAADLSHPDPWYAFSPARRHARAVLAARPARCEWPVEK